MTPGAAAPPDEAALPDLDQPPGRLRRRAFTAAGAVLVLGGASVPFLLGGPFGGDDGTAAAAPSRTAPSGDAGPSAPDPSSSAPSGPTSPRPVTPTPSAAASPRPASSPSAPAVRTPSAPPATRPAAPAPSTPRPTSGATADPAVDRSDQVYVEPSDYVGGQASVARVGLASDGLLTTTTYELSDTELTGTVLRLSPTGWVEVGTVVELTVAL